MRKIFLSLLITSFILVACEKKKVPNYEVSVDELKQHIEFLASDSLKGRKPGTAEGKIAAEYIKVQFQNYGLELLGDGGFEYFEFSNDIALGDSNYLILDHDLTAEKDAFIPYAFSANASLDTNVVFAGYGFDIQSREFSWNDFKNIDVSGKWVMLLKDAPRIEHSRNFSMFNDDKSKVLTVEDKGGLGVIFVSAPGYDSTDALPELKYKRSSNASGIPVIHIRREFANKILEKENLTIAQIESAINSKARPYSMDLHTKLKAKVDIKYVKATTQNVIAKVEGSDSVLKNEYIVIGAHYDHLGMGGEGSNSRSLDTLAPHNGADDNASGVAGIIELAGKFQSMKDSLKRSLIFIAFTAEEMGLLGSKYFVNNQLIDFSKVKAMVNFDMIGRLDSTSRSLMIGGVGTSEENIGIVEEQAVPLNFKLRTSSEGYGPSDHASFYSKDIPVFFISTGAHEDYHTINDDFDKINYNGEMDVLKFGEAIIMELVNRDHALVFKEAGPKERVGGHRYGSGIKFGIMPDFTDSHEEGMGVDAVTDPNGPAANGGMKKGDVIIAIEGKHVNGIQDYMLRLKSLQPGQTITVDVKRNGELKVLILQL